MEELQRIISDIQMGQDSILRAFEYLRGKIPVGNAELTPRLHLLVSEQENYVTACNQQYQGILTHDQFTVAKNKAKYKLMEVGDQVFRIITPHDLPIVKPKLNILWLAANPRNTKMLRLNAECNEVHETLRRVSGHDKWDIIPRFALRVDRLQEALMLPPVADILHFSGHGHHGELVLENTDLTPMPLKASLLVDMVRNIRNGHPLDLVLLNCCKSSAFAADCTAIAKYAIGTTDIIQDDMASAFSVAFYRAFALLHDVQRAFESAILEIRVQEFPDWEKYRIYPQS